jgi:hypothetical protein
MVNAYTTTACVTDARRAAQTKVLRRLEDSVAPASLRDIDAQLIEAFLASRLAAGAGPNTVRKERGMIMSFYGSPGVLWVKRRPERPRLARVCGGFGG